MCKAITAALVTTTASLAAFRERVGGSLLVLPEKEDENEPWHRQGDAGRVEISRISATVPASCLGFCFSDLQAPLRTLVNLAYKAPAVRAAVVRGMPPLSHARNRLPCSSVVHFTKKVVWPLGKNEVPPELGRGEISSLGGASGAPWDSPFCRNKSGARVADVGEMRQFWSAVSKTSRTRLRIRGRSCISIDAKYVAILRYGSFFYECCC